MYRKVPGPAARSKNCKWYSSLPLGALVSLFYVILVSFASITLYITSQRVFTVVVISLSTQSGNFWIHPRM